MKKIFTGRWFTMICLFFVANLISLWSFAQDSASQSSTSTQTSTTSSNFVMQPWMWVVGGIVLLVIIIAITSRNKSSVRADKVTYTKTVQRDDTV